MRHDNKQGAGPPHANTMLGRYLCDEPRTTVREREIDETGALLIAPRQGCDERIREVPQNPLGWHQCDPHPGPLDRWRQQRHWQGPCLAEPHGTSTHMTMAPQLQAGGRQGLQAARACITLQRTHSQHKGQAQAQSQTQSSAPNANQGLAHNTHSKYTHRRATRNVQMKHAGSGDDRDGGGVWAQLTRTLEGAGEGRGGVALAASRPPSRLSSACIALHTRPTHALTTHPRTLDEKVTRNEYQLL